jgi:hypothetical protein
MIYNFKDFVTKVDENVNSAEFLNNFGLTEEEDAAAADAPVEDDMPKEDEAPSEDEALEAFKKEHLDVMFNELSSDDFDSFYSSEFKEWKEMEDGEEKEAKKEEILNKIKDMFQLSTEEKEEEAPAEDEDAPAEEPAAEEAPEA